MSDTQWDRARIEVDWRLALVGRGTLRFEFEFSGPDDPRLATLLEWHRADLETRLAKEGGDPTFLLG